MADGKISLAYSSFLGYDKGEDGGLVINPEQAKTVRYIFKSFLEGKTPYTISRELMDLGYKTGTGRTTWGAESVVRILRNEKYAGNAVLQKTYKTDLLSKRKVNNGEVQKYFVSDSHEAIISEEEYDMAQQELEARKNSLRQHSAKSIFTDRIICGDCGTAYGSKVWHSTDKYRKVIWKCNAKFKNEQKCSTPHLTEDEIKVVFVKALNKFIVNKDNIIPDLKAIRAMLMDTTQLEKQLTEAQAELDVAAGLLNSYFNGKPITEEDVASGRFEAMQERYNIAKQKTDSLTNQINDLKNRSQRMQRFISKVEKLNTQFDSFSPEMWLGLADHMTVYSKDKITVTFRCGTEI